MNTNRGGWSGGTVADNTNERRLAWIAFFAALAATAAILIACVLT